MKYKWEPEFHPEMGIWFVHKMSYMSEPKFYCNRINHEVIEFETQYDAQKMADYLNKRDDVYKTVEKKT